MRCTYVPPKAKDADAQMPTGAFDLKALTVKDAEAEVLKKAQTEEFRDKMAGAKIEIIALMDVFTLDTKVDVSVKVRR